MKHITSIFVALLFVNTAYTQLQEWNYLNFECGGYVTEIIPVKYPSGRQPSSIGQQVLYARTDIGGVYRSSNNGVSWEYVSKYLNYPSGGQPGISGSELSIQGLAVRYDAQTGKEIIHVAWGNDSADARKIDFQSIWRSPDNGATWPLPKPTIHGQVWFRGNNFPVKLGGPCITYDPNNNPNGPYNMYMGGFPPTGQQCRLYKSVDDGVSWRYSDVPEVRDFPGLSNEGIICIGMKSGNTNHIWVGTTHGIVFTTNGGVNWQRKNILKDGQVVSMPYVKRILLKKEGTNITGAMVTWGNWTQTGIGRLMVNNNWQYVDITTNFLTGYTGGTGSGMFSTLTFVDSSETIILAGKYERPLRKTKDFGNNWYGEVNNSPYNEVVFRYTQSGHNFPAHQQSGELHPNWGFIYDGLSFLTKNPNSGWGSDWYLSGGAGARMTVIGADTNFANSRWKYTTLGQSMTVNYDVVFSKVNNREAIYLPLSDWTLGWTYQDRLSTALPNGLIQDTLSYDRQETRPGHLFDTYISNVTRILIHPDKPETTYCVGGSVYDFVAQYPTGYPENYRAGFYKRVLSSNGTFTTERKTTDEFLRVEDRAIVDAIIYKKPDNQNRIIALVGKNQSTSQIGSNTTLGIFYTDDGGDNWSRGDFGGTSGVPALSTQTAFSASIISGLKSGSLGDIFGGHFHLAYLGGSRVGLWLENGGMFVSTNNGANWSVVPTKPHTGYLGAGSLKYIENNEVTLAVKGFGYGQKGLYKGKINSNNTDISWSEFGSDGDNYFTSAEHLDVHLDRWVVNGKRGNDLYNQIYLSTDNGSNWTRISPTSPPHLTKVKSVRIRPYSNELWVATGG